VKNINKFSIELTGGLGNQLFGVALLVTLKNYFQCTGYLNTYQYNIPNQQRRLEVEHILVREGIEVNNIISKHLFRESNPFIFDKKVFEIGDETLLSGYFQSIKYFENCFDEVRKFILGGSSDRLLSKMSPGIAVHIRRGDYLNSRFHGICQPQYYLSAIRLLRNIWGDLPVIIFSDDEIYAESFKYQISNSSLHSSNGEKPFETLIEMSKYSCLVASNSSFSFWSGFLSNKSYGEIILPNKWTNSQEAYELILPGWTTIDKCIGTELPFK
jgi:hypothetical protein